METMLIIDTAMGSWPFLSLSAPVLGSADSGAAGGGAEEAAGTCGAPQVASLPFGMLL